MCIRDSGSRRHASPGEVAQSTSSQGARGSRRRTKPRGLQVQRQGKGGDAAQGGVPLAAEQ
eukprot:2204475-Alexandrium_andersonii.AAC.1